MKNLTAANRAIKALAPPNEHAGLVELVRTLARSLDAGGCSECGTSDANIAREYRQALKELAVVGLGGDDGGAAEFLVSISTPRGASVVDT